MDNGANSKIDSVCSENGMEVTFGTKLQNRTPPNAQLWLNILPQVKFIFWKCGKKMSFSIVKKGKKSQAPQLWMQQ